MRSYGDAIRRGHFRVHSRFEHVVNFLDGENLVSIVDHSVGAGPTSIILDRFTPTEWSALAIYSNRMLLDRMRIDLNPANQYQSRIAFPQTIEQILVIDNIASLHELVVRQATPDNLAFLLSDDEDIGTDLSFKAQLRTRFFTAKAQLAAGQIEAGISLIKGVGVGLTPSGDDFIAGAMVALHLRQHLFPISLTQLIDQIYQRSHSTNPIVATMLRQAHDGRVNEKWQRLITALTGNELDRIKPLALDVLATGATSGVDMMVGFLFGLTNFRCTHDN